MEKLSPLPCPACGSEHSVVARNFSPWFTAGSHVLCIDCQMQGPIACSQREADATTIEDLREMIEPTGFESAAITSWNSLPRRPDYNDVDCAGCPERRRSALTWGEEPPKVPGWYWWRWAKYQGWMCLAVRDGLIVEHPRKVLRHAQDIGGQWAGPIAPPLEPEES